MFIKEHLFFPSTINTVSDVSICYLNIDIKKTACTDVKTNLDTEVCIKVKDCDILDTSLNKLYCYKKKILNLERV